MVARGRAAAAVLAAAIVYGKALESNDGANQPAYDEKTHVHLVYSTGCDQPLRQFLTASLQMSLARVGHVGPLTQLISGCSDEKRAGIEQEPTFYSDFRLHFTKDYAQYTSPNFTEHYTAYNKPFGMRDFLQNAAKKDNLAIAFIDADYMLFKPVLINQGQQWGKYYQNNTVRRAEDVNDTVKDGIALAQNMKAFLGGRWFNDYNRTILNLVCDGLPCKNVSSPDAFEYFEPAGTPYILTRNDWLRMIDNYCDFTVRGRQLQKDWMVEMYAYGAAVANHNIRHTLVKHLGPATPEFQNTEYWQFLDDSMENPCEDLYEPLLPADPPVGIHYAMYYGLPGDINQGYMYYKYRIPGDILKCDSLFFKLPPATEWTSITKEFAGDDKKIYWKRHAVWLECTLIKYGNQVLHAMKSKLCPHGFNTRQGIVLHASQTPKTAMPVP